MTADELPLLRAGPRASRASRRPTWRWLLRLAVWLLALSPAVVPLWMICRDGVDVPIQDQFEPEILDVSLAASQGHVSPLLFAQHNEHRVLVPKLIYLTLDPLSHGNTRVQMLAEWAVVLGTSLGVLGLLRQSEIPRGFGLALPWFACNVLIFSPVQLENWLWGIGLMNVLPVAFTVATLLVLRRPGVSLARLGAAAVCATAATFSSGNGILAWGVGAVLLAAEPRPLRLRNLLAWSAAAGLVAGLFIRGYHRAPAEMMSFNVEPSTRVWYVLAFLGSPFAYMLRLSGDAPAAWAEIVGAFFLVLAGVLAWRAFSKRGDAGRRDLLVWACLAGFAVLSAVMASLTRAQLGTAQAITSRYSTFAIYLPIAVIGAAGEMLRRNGRMEQRAYACGLCLLTFFSAAAYPEALQRSNITRITRLQAKAALLLAKVLPDNPLIATLLHPDASVVLRQAPKLDTAGWLNPPMIGSADARELQLVPAPAPASVGQVERFDRLNADSYGVSGWALRPGRRDSAQAVFITARAGAGPEQIVAMAFLGNYRQDIAGRFGPASLISGWDAEVPASKLARLRSPQRGPLEIHAWSLDVETAKAARMAGDVAVEP